MGGFETINLLGVMGKWRTMIGALGNLPGAIDPAMCQTVIL
jgi:hypothetical protein